jgi:hypothetical protein
VDREKKRTILSGLLVGTLFALCGVLGALQYRWNAEVSSALRDRLRATLDANLRRLSRDFNGEIAGGCNALAPLSRRHWRSAEAEVAAKYRQWAAATRRRGMLRRVGFAIPQEGSIELHMLDQESGTFKPSEWPAGWKNMESRLTAVVTPGPHGDFAKPGRGPEEYLPGPPYADEGTVFEQPIFGSGFGHGPAEAPPGRRELAWLIFDINPGYLRDVLLPEQLQRHLGTGGTLDYQVEVVNRYDTSQPI